MTHTKAAAHTPGPWNWMDTPSVHSLDYPSDSDDILWNGVASEEFPSFDCLRGADGTVLVLVGCGCNDGTAEVGVHSAADARLIAAAPDLLAALKEAERTLALEGYDSYPTLTAVRDAIAKAEGVA